MAGKLAEGEVIFVYTLVKYIAKDYRDFITNEIMVADLIKLLNTLVGGGKAGTNIFNNIVAIYENLRKNNRILQDQHQNLVNSKSNCFAYVKYRQDSALVNPRYKVSIIDSGHSKYLHLIK